MTPQNPAAEPLAAARWALLAALSALAVWLGAGFLPAQADQFDGGVLFGAYLILSGWLLTAAGAWARKSLRGLGWPALLLSPLVAWLFYRGTEAAAESMVNFGAIPYFAAGTLLWAALIAEAEPPAPLRRPPNPWLWAAFLVLAGLALGLVVAALRNWTHANLRWNEDRTSVDMLLVVRDGGGASDIGGGPFQQWAWMPVVLLWAALVGALLALKDRVEERLLPWLLYALAFFGKVALAGLSSQGLGILALKIESVNTNYFTLAGKLDGGPWGFLEGFNANQATAGFHANTHPPLPVLLYWLLRTLFLGHSLPVALVIMALSAAAVWPFYRLGRAWGGPQLGLAAAALFLTSPLNLILGNAGIDSVVFTLVATSLWLLWESVDQASFKWAALSGASLGLATLNSFGSSASLVFLGTWGLLLVWRRRSSAWDFLGRSASLWSAFALGALAMHLGLFAVSLGHFNYLKAVSTAQFVHLSANQYRPFDLWSWANVVLYAGYTGLGLLALWCLGLGGSLLRWDHSDPSVMAGAATVVTLMMTAYGRAEVQRQYLFGAVFLLPVALKALPRDPEGRPQMQGLSAALLLNIVGAVALQMTVLDYW